MIKSYDILIETYFSFSSSGDIIMLFVPQEEGQGLVEYALILVLVAIVVIAILTLLGPQIGNVFSGIINGLK
jgi:pilus assembly protein Flp/PilA